MSKGNAETVEVAAEPVQQPQVVWSDKNMVSNFANVVNIQSTKDQIDLFFGTNQTWNLSQSNGVTVDLSSRIILTPHVAKRLCQSLTKLLAEHEARHGVLTD
ncbi:DUF3467 domain-containing protein [Pseudomaricurvus sp. HS19]|uniref:DUF3467 domain-containing protein n=1 Tax=Pseudomaricurvus sp. HS19 TaxID=2692626 RepID=UPI00136FB0FF|nr:DUF3467 domain-containing protein [Pseudomaricurvus sp. HS19]MYM61956.1 DUF3467 domain-containing protein [Pseudomaricurvus sp. HS19]